MSNETTPDLREQIAEAVANWAYVYPIASWGLATDPTTAQKLARSWGDSAANAILIGGLQRRFDEQAAENERLRKLNLDSGRLLTRLKRELGEMTTARDTLAAMSAGDLARADKAESLLRDLIDPDDCWFDHNGGCQAHGYLNLKPGELCPHAEAKEVLAALDLPAVREFVAELDPRGQAATVEQAGA